MQYIADFHIHSKYSRATGKNTDTDHLYQRAKIKGIDVLGTGDFTHPLWLKELKEKLEPLGNGLLKLKNAGGNDVCFILTTEISCIYSKGGKVRRIHILVFAPDFDTVEKINGRLAEIGNLKSDGRPILGLDAKELTKIILDASPQCLVVPAHAWTPWFSVFGSKSGFNSLEECFEEMTPYIYAIETGLSSDPAMNWRLSALDNITLISNSDAHSPANLGREANVFEFDGGISYAKIIKALRNKGNENFKYTIEFFPEEGKYHYDGHRLCKICFSPEATEKNKGLCPVCKKPLTIGVMNRVAELADRESGYSSDKFIPFKSLVPLPEIIGQAFNKGKQTKIVDKEYQNLIKRGKNEFNILLNLSYEELLKITLPEVALNIKNMRENKVEVSPGYDGVYGTIKILREKKTLEQNSLF